MSDTIGTNTTWNTDTVKIADTIVINNGITLTITAGTRVEFLGTYKIVVKGRMLAQGVSSDSIRFSALDTSAGWLGIRFNSTPATNDSSVFEYCRFEYSRSTAANISDPHRGALSFVSFSKASVSHSTFAKNSVAGFSGALSCINASPLIFDNLFTGNATITSAGGAIACNSASPSIINNRIIGNSATLMGGGIYLEMYSSPLILNNIITGNTVPNGSGGGIVAGNGSPTIVNNLIAHNSCRNYGGGILCDHASPKIINCTIVNNSTAYWGGGLNCLTASPTLTNTIITGNTAGQYGPQVYLWDSTSAANFYYCDVQGGVSGFGKFSGSQPYKGTYLNNIETYPKFADSASGVFSLIGSSPCINVGMPDTAGLGLPLADIAGNPRIYAGAVARVDIGAYEYQGETGIRELAPKVNWISAPRLFCCNTVSGTVMHFSLPGTGSTSLKIYNIKGELLSTLVSGNLGAGSYVANWEARNAASGVYFACFQAGNEKETKRFALKR